MRKLLNKASDQLWLAGSLLAAGALYFSNISRWSIWHDESYTAMLISYDWADILRRTALDVHPPFYYLVLKAWTSILGNSLLVMRSLSALFMLGLIIAAYLLMRQLFGRHVARLSTVFLVLAPYLLRYAQEARMYAMVALLLLLGTYTLLRAVQTHSRKLLYLYALLMALAIYSHYYAIFLLPAHWLYLLLRTKRKGRLKHSIDLKSWHWWGANVCIGLLLAPWLPTAYKQFTSIQGAFWIQPVDVTTFFDTLVHFLIYKDPWNVSGSLQIAMIILVAAILITMVAAIVLNKLYRKRLLLLTAYAFLAPIIIFVLSLPPFQPVYNNRYFSLTAVAFYLLLAVLIFMRPLNRYRPAQIVVALLITATLGFGLVNVRAAGNYNPDRNEYYTMAELSQTINRAYREGDAIVSTNLSTYFDIRYHNRTAATVRLKVDKTPNGIGNTSLVYDRPDILLSDYEQLTPHTNTIWLVTDSYDVRPRVPEHWRELERVQDGYAAIVEYRLEPH